jgi:hypothetical protein
MQGEAILQKAAMVTQMKPTSFKTGSDGFRGNCKVVEGGVKYQVNVMAIRCGSGNGKGKGKSRKS